MLVFLGQWVITIVKDAFVTGFKELHTYDPLKHQLVLHYVVHIRVGLKQTGKHQNNKTFQVNETSICCI